MQSTTSAAAQSSASRSFFGAITERVRGRSRSRSPAPTRTAQTSETAVRQQQPQQQPIQQAKRPAATPVVAYRTASQSTTSTNRSSTSSDWDQMVYGRHSSDWIFKSQRSLKRQSTGGSSQYSR